MTSDMLELAVRGFLLVGLVSWQTVNLQRGGVFRIWVGAFLLGCCWYFNVLAAVQELAWGWVPYATGSACGAVVGWRVSRIRFVWK
tara:strand:+ start:2867 stop:3124 length:258 start_codon:yes stop_codon:yes gene_type:complete